MCISLIRFYVLLAIFEQIFSLKILFKSNKSIVTGCSEVRIEPSSTNANEYTVIVREAEKKSSFLRCRATKRRGGGGKRGAPLGKKKIFFLFKEKSS